MIGVGAARNLATHLLAASELLDHGCVIMSRTSLKELPIISYSPESNTPNFASDFCAFAELFKAATQRKKSSFEEL